MTDLDKIARDIFWARLTPGSLRVGRSKAAQWNGLTEDARQGWRMIARNFVQILGALPLDTLNIAHAMRGNP